MNFQLLTFNFQLNSQYETKPQAQGGRGYAELLFFSTAEGYVKALYPSNPAYDVPMKYQYIYIYKDHLGNNRLSYTLDPRTNHVKILEENNYYPFGLKHGNYNAIRKDVKYKEELASKKEIKQVMTAQMKFKYLYQEQERQDELGLNWDSFKYRNYDYAIGRFMSVDPLAEKYPYNGVYNFSEDRIIDSRELEGMERLSVHTPNWYFRTQTIRNLPPTNAQRNSATVGVAILHPIASNSVGEVEFGGTNISTISGRIARHVAENKNMSTGLGSERNAFRHALWSGAITSRYGVNTAELIGNAHEGIPVCAQDNAHVDFNQPSPDNLEGADSVVDFLNNEIGREIGKELGADASEWDVAVKVLGIQLKVGLWTTTTDKDGNITISRTKITRKQYNTALSNLRSLNIYGMNDADRKEIEDKKKKK